MSLYSCPPTMSKLILAIRSTRSRPRADRVDTEGYLQQVDPTTHVVMCSDNTVDPATAVGTPGAVGYSPGTAWALPVTSCTDLQYVTPDIYPQN